MSRIIYKCIISVIVFCGIAISLKAQELRYKDVFEVVKTQSDESAYEILRKYQEQDPYSANVYYQLGIIAQKWSKKYDPLIDYENVSYFLYHANLYYSICLKYLDEKEVHRNDEYYQQAKIAEGQKRLEYNDVLIDVNGKINAVKDCKDHIELIRTYYFGAVSNYNQSLQSFLDLNIKNNKLKDIYLTANNQLINKISDIGLHFDSTLMYFNQYQGAISEFPIGDYHQKYSLLPIETYKLEGLTESDFLQNEVHLWNYRAWVDTVLQVINTDIKALRADISKEGEKQKKLLEFCSDSVDYTDTLKHYYLDEKLGYRIGRFDYQPIILNLFTYNTEKINFIIDCKNPVNNPLNQSDSSIAFANRLVIYNQLVDQKQKADEALTTLKEQTSEYKVNKYLSFINQNYTDFKGFNQFISDQPNRLNQELDSSMNRLKQSVLSEIQSISGDRRFIVYKKSHIPLALTSITPEQAEPDTYYTSAYVQDENRNYYLTGFIKAENKNLKAFVVKADSLLKPLWIKSYDFSTGGKLKLENIGKLISLTYNGCVVVVHSRTGFSDSAIIENRIIRFSGDGKDIYKAQLHGSKVPCFMNFDAINEKLLMAFGGTSICFSQAIPDSLIVEYADSIGSSIWTTALQLNGILTNMVRSNDKFIVIGNYKQLNDNQQDYQSQNDGYAGFLTVLNSQGIVELTKPFSLTQACMLTHAIKLNSETLNLIGFKTKPSSVSCEQKPESNAGFFYQLIDPKGNIKFVY